VKFTKKITLTDAAAIDHSDSIPHNASNQFDQDWGISQMLYGDQEQ